MTKQIQTAFDTIHADDALKQRTLDYLTQTIYQKNHRPVSHRRVAPVLAACLLIVLCLSGSWLYFTPTAYISVDIIPSLELGINRFDRVISVDAYNEDGSALADTLDLRNLDYRDALDEIVNDGTLDAYLESGVLSLTVAGESESQCDEIYQVMEDCSAGRGNIQCHIGSAESVAEAHGHGMSVGKYRAYLVLQELNPDVTPEEVQGMTMREIYQLIRSYEAAGSSTANPELPSGGYWNGAGQGRGHRHGTQ